MGTMTNCLLCNRGVLLGTSEADGFNHKICVRDAVEFVEWLQLQHHRAYRDWQRRWRQHAQEPR